MERYGVEYTFQNAEIKQKCIETVFARYGVDNVSKLDNIKKKKQETLFKNYGVLYTMQSPELREKQSNTKYHNGAVATSYQQYYLSKLYGMELNMPVKYYNVDMCDVVNNTFTVSANTAFTAGSVVGTPSICYDVSGYKYNGTNSASLTVSTDTPRYTHSTIFNGSNSAISKSEFSIGNQWSYGMWYKSADLSSGWQSVLLLNTSGGDADTQLGFYTNHSQNRLQSTANGSYNSQIALLHDTNWHHYFCTYDGSSMKTYLDGALVDTTTITAALKQRSNLVVGARSNNSAGTAFTAYFSGQLSDFRMYATVLTTEDIAELHNTSVSISNN